LPEFTNFYRRRIYAGLWRREVASAVGIGNSTLADIERGKRLPSLKQLIALSKFYNISAHQLIDCKNYQCSDCNKVLTWPLDVVYEHNKTYLCAICSGYYSKTIRKGGTLHYGRCSKRI
jgi:transcriptional regulator with XRE-family HTH domain